jgi:hypothetical protein
MPKAPKKTAKATGREGPLARSSGNVCQRSHQVSASVLAIPPVSLVIFWAVRSASSFMISHAPRGYLVCSASILISGRIPSVLVPWPFHAPRLTQASQRNSKWQSRSPTSPCRGRRDSFHIQRASQCFRSGFRAQLSPPSPPCGHLLPNNSTHPLSWVLQFLETARRPPSRLRVGKLSRPLLRPEAIRESRQALFRG